MSQTALPHERSTVFTSLNPSTVYAVAVMPITGDKDTGYIAGEYSESFYVRTQDGKGAIINKHLKKESPHLYGGQNLQSGYCLVT